MVALLVTLILCGGAVAYVLLPVVRPRSTTLPAATPEADLLRERQESTYVALRDLDFEYELGNLAPDDYFAMRERYARRAMALLKAVDERERDATAAVEEAVRSLRAARQSGAEDSAGATCGHCGAVLPPNALACPVCATRTRFVVRSPVPARATETSPYQWVRMVGGLVLVSLVGSALVYELMPARTSAPTVLSTLPTASIRGLSVAPGRQGEVLVVTPDGLLIGNEAGSVWRALTRQVGLSSLAVTSASTTPSRIWVSAGDVLKRSDDGGVTFTEGTRPRPGAVIQSIASLPSDPNLLYVIVSDGLIGRSSDGGMTWTFLPDRIKFSDATSAVTSLAIVPGDSPVLFASSATSGIVVSVDSGRRWTAANGFVNGLLPTSRVTALVYDAASGDRAVAPDGSVLHGALYAGTDVGLFKSTDGGRSWRQLGLHLPLRAFSIDTADSKHVIAVDELGRLYSSHDRGETWGR